MSDNPTTLHASAPQLIKATAVALLAAGALLVTTVLPAEYGIDPTGIGKALGFTALHQAGADAALKPTGGLPPTATQAVTASAGPFQSGEITLTLAPDEGSEIKALMRAGEAFVFSWQASGPVNFDMHGEKPGGGQEEFSSYWKDRGQTAASGSFTAPFDGTHGWYWRNRGDAPVTITVKVSGYFEKLYQP